MNGDTHQRSVVVWDVPTAIERGKTFNVKVGLKCGSGCKPDGWPIEIRDHEGNAVARATLGSESWPGTAALYYSEVTLTAPDRDGLHGWEAFAPQEGGRDVRHGGDAQESSRDHGHRDHDAEDAHDEARASFNVRVVPAPDCRITVVALDKATQVPVKGAKVAIHPYRAVTNERGIAQVRVPKGAYRLFVSGRDYFPFRSGGEVTADVTVTAELEPDFGPSDAELWS